MLPERKMSTEYPELAEPRTVRLRFTKTGALQYVSHLDLQRSFGRILARADLPLWFTQGFNPHPKLVFARPLAIGCESVCELADIRINRDMPCEEICERMKKASVKELDFLSCYIPQRKFSEIENAAYCLIFNCPPKDRPAPASIKELLTTSPLVMTKKTKSGDKETDIVPLIKNVRISADTDGTVLWLVLSATEGNTLNPELVVSAMRQKLGFPAAESEYRIIREYMSDASGKEFI